MVGNTYADSWETNGLFKVLRKILYVVMATSKLHVQTNEATIR